ncbi:hypothetical protein L228DRAFT_249146 [Xylona heveae TC161]|uniref:Zn(2)-C6 fungal-type domain-containing protein n=1 Tax=Xylona heveae (strain CBS 132557 / TC161) TaxID=1328760 RepID=A0A165FT12_XYLHT|nr:hypothetical protein L228DRAFT_249146 [Xylona heveae TC161]KZF21338.1 hypothetical protein L228DRAFT_249146 [Xylona heveae TC161]
MSGETNSSGQQTRRAANACQRCRSRKVKCSGKHPCNNCEKRSLECIFDEEDRKILVSERLYQELKRKVQDIETGHYTSNKRRRTSQEDETYDEDNVVDDREISPESAPGTGDDQHHSRDEPCFSSNPLVSPSKYIKDKNGSRRRTWYYLGPSSTWSFSRRVLNLLNEQLRPSTPRDIPLAQDGDAYKIRWTRAKPDEPPDISALPPLDFSIYLMNTVKFNLGQVYRLFDEEEFLRNLYEFYGDSFRKVDESRLWYCQFLLILAFGKAFLMNRKPTSDAPVGVEYFVRAMSLLPEFPELWMEPILAIEVLALIALYLHSVDMRDSSYCYLGQALRMAVVEGLHRSLPVEQLGEKLAQRSSNIWWTVYILERKLSLSLGVPVFVRETDITSELVDPTTSPPRTAALVLNVKISRVISYILNTVYGVDERLDGQFPRKIRSVLRQMAGLATELEAVFESKFKNSVDSLSGVTTRLNLAFHHCIILATRPLIVCVLSKRLEQLREADAPRTISSPVQQLINCCIDSAKKSLLILSALCEHGLVENFTQFDTEYAFSAAFILTLTSAIIPGAVPDREHKEIANEVLNEMIRKGNAVAQFRKNELAILDDLVEPLHAAQNGQHGAQSSVEFTASSELCTNGNGTSGWEIVIGHSPNLSKPSQQFTRTLRDTEIRLNGAGTKHDDSAFPHRQQGHDRLTPSSALPAPSGNSRHSSAITPEVEDPLTFDWADFHGNVGLSPGQMLSMADQLDINSVSTDAGTDSVTQGWIWNENA